MKNYFTLLFAGLFMFLGSCTDSDEIMEQVEVVEETPEEPTPNPYADINDYIWKGMNEVYLWKNDVPDLADDRFANSIVYQDYLRDSGTPPNFFDSLIYDKENVDFFSFMVDDYVELENSLQGTSASNGVDFDLYTDNNFDVYAVVKLISPWSDASDKNIKRGDVFIEVNGIPLNVNNYRSLLFSEDLSYTLTMAKFEGNVITPTGETVDLTKSQYDEIPVFVNKVFEEGGRKIGYLLYTEFNSFESELNAAILELKSQGITDLIVDLRYNPGGWATVSTSFASMLTGQFKGEIIKQEIWNDLYQAYWESECPECLVEVFDDKTSGAFSDEPINSLNLTKVSFITSDGTASASESLMSGLMPYIDVQIIGDRTFGKYTGSFTLYDSENFGRDGANPEHTYAIQPIIYRFSNKLGGSPKGGIAANIYQVEERNNMGILGDRNEPLLNTALNDIIGISAKTDLVKSSPSLKISDSRLEKKYATKFIDNDPKVYSMFKKMYSKE